MNLVIDIGNTLLKYAIFDKGKIVYQNAFCSSDPFLPEIFFSKNKKIKKAVLSSVRVVTDEIISNIKSYCKIHVIGADTKLPFKNLYKTPETLGNDRIAALTAARTLYPDRNVLIIDAGTCITMDFLNARGEYRGGTISPGLNMKLNALHTFTGKLPLVDLRSFDKRTGFDTKTSILSGIINGSIAEIEMMVDLNKKKFSKLIVLLCGGDATFLAKKLKSSIFVLPDLVLIGLNELLEYNEN